MCCVRSAPCGGTAATDWLPSAAPPGSGYKSVAVANQVPPPASPRVAAWEPDVRRTLGLKRSATVLSERVAERLWADILSGVYGPGQRLTEQMLSERLGVSRGPVREALRMLETDRVVTLKPRRGAYVRSLSSEEFLGIAQVRASLLGLAARLFAERATDGEIAELGRQALRMTDLAETAPPEEYTQITYRLSLDMVKGSRNSELISILRALSNRTLRYTYLGLLSKGQRRESARNWRILSQAIERREADRAEALLRGTIERAGECILRQLEGAEAITPVPVEGS
jgi:DNA-binding GntR family transcriptional regulator